MLAQESQEKVFSRGDVVTVAKGAIVYSTHPYKKERILTRKQSIKVHSYYPEIKEFSGYPGKAAQIHWAGTGGYWCWTDASNVIS